MIGSRTMPYFERDRNVTAEMDFVFFRGEMLRVTCLPPSDLSRINTRPRHLRHGVRPAGVRAAT